MTYIKVHWRSRPHHIPQIRVTPTSSSASRQSLSRRAAEYAVRRPLSSSLASARIKQKASVRRVKKTGLVSVPSNFEKAQGQAPYQLQVPQLHRRSVAPPGCLRSHPDRFHHLSIQQYSIIPPTDGACHSTSRSRRQARLNSEKTRSQDESIAFTRQPFYTPTSRHRRTVRHSISLSPTGTLRLHKILRRRITGRDDPDDSRINKSKFNIQGHIPAAERAQTSSKSTVRPQIFAATGSADLSNQRISSIVKRMEPGSRKQEAQLVPPQTSRLSVSFSRSPSERKELKRFQKELERHLCRTRDLPRQQSSSSSVTPLSAYTIKEFLPYRTEFVAANLAVTSDEQRGIKSGKAGPYQSPNLSAIQTVCAQDIREGELPRISSQIAQVETSQSSDATATTILAFTPPRDLNYRKTPSSAPKDQYSCCVATKSRADHKFEPKTSPISLKSTTRQRLPWLRDDRSPALPDAHLVTAIVNECGQDQPSVSSVNDILQVPTTEASWVLENDVLLSPRGRRQLNTIASDSCNKEHEDAMDNRSVEAHSSNQNSYSSAFDIPHKVISAPLDKSHLMKESMCVAGLQPMHVKSALGDPLQSDVPLLGCSNSQEQMASLMLLDDNKDKHHAYVTDPGYPQSSNAKSRTPSLSRSDTHSASLYHQKTFRDSGRKVPGSDQICLPRSPITMHSRRKILVVGSAQGHSASRSSHSRRLLSLGSVTSFSSKNTIQTRRGMIPDKDVFRGLQVATSAACDEDVDKWIEEITGIGVRRLLADLSRFDGLGINGLANVARRAAKQRREEVRRWELVRAKTKSGISDT